jgi:predicted nucleic acid-binding protein
MILCDTGVIVAALDKRDADHHACATALKKVREPLLTTWPCITEAMYLVGERSGTGGQEKLREFIERGVFQLTVPTLQDAMRACALMRQYADSPMDFADASLVVAAETQNIRQILTLDGHFHAYRINGSTRFEVLP